MIKIENLSKYFRTEEVETIALNHISIGGQRGGIRGYYGTFGMW